MTEKTKYILIGWLVSLACVCFSQNETKKWCVGNHVGIDFMNNPPTTFTHASVNGAVSLSDGAGNLVLYGRNQLYNGSNQAIPNSSYNSGWGMHGGLGVKQPGNNSVYYVFYPGLNGFLYSVVDISLAAGMGSVTAKDATLSPVLHDWRIAGVKHCNGKDVWIMAHQLFNNTFVAYLLTENGINPSPVVTVIGATYTNNIMAECLRFSPSGKRMVTCTNDPPAFELYDFNTSTGSLTNLISLPVYVWPWDAEFSPDETKLYGTMQYPEFYQWDLCAGSPAAIAAGVYTLSGWPAHQKYIMQMSDDGKIHISTGVNPLGVINNPNNPGASCNYVEPDPLISTSAGSYDIPNFVSSYFYHPSKPGPFTFSVNPNLNCQKAYFTAPASPTNNCAASNYSVTGIVWNFGDTLSASNNTSTITTPMHVYTAPGTYTPTLIFKYVCGADTLKQIITISGPSVSVVSNSGDCYTNGSATVAATGGTGPYSYTWMPSGQTGSVISNLPTGNYSVVVYDNGSPCYTTNTLTIVTIIPPVFTVTPASPTICAGKTTTLNIQGNGTAYNWSDGISAEPIFNNQSIVTPSATQTYTIIGYLNSCTNAVTANVSVLPVPSASISISKSKVCLNEIFNLRGAGGQNYMWITPDGSTATGSSVSFTMGSGSSGGAYTLSVTDTNGCQATATQSVFIYPPPQGSIKATKESGCIPLCSNFSLTFSNAVTTVTSWRIGDTLYPVKSFFHCFAIAGEHELFAMIEDTLTTCTNTLSFQIDAYPLPVADFTYLPEKPIEEFDEVIFTNTSKGENLETTDWYFEDNEGYHCKSENSSYLFKAAGIYPVALVVGNVWGCADSVIKLVNVETDFTIYIPNAFTPDGNGLNDVFLPVIRGLKSYDLTIFNRWGTCIFTSTDVETGWDGTFRGELCKNDIYTWKIMLSTTSGTAKELSGFVSLQQ